MSDVALLDGDGRATRRAELAPELASQEIKPHLIHETVVAELGWRRSGTASTRTRSDVRGGGRKPWRQKGTGRARAGSIRAPHWTGGGIVFGPHPRSFGGKVNKKARAQAFRSALKAHTERGTVAVMDTLEWEAPSTKRAAGYLANAPDAFEARPLLVVVDDLDGSVARSFRNLAEVYVLDCWDLDTVDVMSGRSLIVEKAAWEKIGGALGATVEVEPPAKAPKPAKVAPKKPASRQKPPPAAAEEPASGAAADQPTAAEPVAEAPVEEAPANVDEAASVVEAPAEEAAKPKRARATKAKTEDDAESQPEALTDEDAPAKPKRTRAKKAEVAEDAEPQPEAAADDEAKPKRARAKKPEQPTATEPDAEAPAPEEAG